MNQPARAGPARHDQRGLICGELSDSVVKYLLEASTTSELRPGYEGANIGTIIGFKHVNYLVEQGIIEHFRAAGAPVGRLYDEHGLGFDLLELDTRLQTALLVDDIAVVEVVPNTPPTARSSCSRCRSG
ncbi:hypothetical protein NKG94_03585 [Micromonospora sp. M12]